MPFNIQFWGKISTTGSSEFVIGQDGVGIVEGAPALFSYGSNFDTLAEILEDDIDGNSAYFNNTSIFADVKTDDLIYIAAQDGETWVTVRSVNYYTHKVAIDRSVGGNVSNITDAVGTVVNNSVAIFADTTGRSIRQSVMTVEPPPAEAAGYQALIKNVSVDPNVVLKGIEGIEFRDLAGFIWLNDGVDAFGIMGLFMDELFAQRCIIISDGASVPSSFDAILELNTTQGTFLPPRLTTTQRDALANPLPGMQFYNTTTNAMELYSSGSWGSISGGGITSISAGGGITCTPNPITSTGTVALEAFTTNVTINYPDSITRDVYGRITAASGGTVPVLTIQADSATIPTIIFTQPTSGNYVAQVPSDANCFYYSFSIVSGGTGQSIPFSGIGVDIFLTIDPTLYNVAAIFNPKNWAIENSNQTIRILAGTDAGFNRGYYEVELQLTIDMGSLPTSDGNYGKLDIGLGWPSPASNRYNDFFHPSSGQVSGSTRYKAIVKGMYIQSGNSSPADDILISFPMQNIGGPGAWTIHDGMISIRRVGTELI